MKQIANAKMSSITGGSLPVSEFIVCGALFEIIWMGSNNQAATAASWFELLDCKSILNMS